MPPDNGQTTLEICFEEDEQLYKLKFKKDHKYPDGYFYLDYVHKVQDGDEKGSISYGGKPYKVKYSGEKPPYLLINLEQKDIEQPYTRIVQGRRIKPDDGVSSGN